MVQRSVLVLPAKAVNEDVGLLASEKEPPLPDTIDQEPLPDVGVLPVSVVEVKPHLVWSLPAAAVLGFETTVTETESCIFILQPKAEVP